MFRRTYYFAPPVPLHHPAARAGHNVTADGRDTGRPPTDTPAKEVAVQGNEQRRREAMKNLERELGRRDRAEKAKPLGVVVTTLAILSSNEKK